ncbi:MAG: membrane protein insertase YidC [Tropheryma whipplei]|nr:membrane protein insertase YidC [Tropheryma whipplei]MCO8182758.1 membrane protein insertase YidC [Tropheryma whipplei]MCO8190647.1 membrane protein insertase YidC [Tropheryma whipplei]
MGSRLEKMFDGLFDFLQNILLPIKWVIEQILVFFHTLLGFLGFGDKSGLSWALSIVGLVIVIRATLIPVFLKQIRAQRKMLEIAPEVRRIQEKYKGKRDVLSRQSMNQEMMEIYRVRGANPLSSCLPIVLQMPVFFGLYQVIESAQNAGTGVGPLNGPLGMDFRDSRIFGVVPLHDSFSHDFYALQAGQAFNLITMIVAGVLTAIMIAVQLFTQLKVIPKNIPENAKNTSVYKNQKVMLYLLPIMFLGMGFSFPVGILIYWTASNVWSAVQQAVAIYRNPSPGSLAFELRRKRLGVQNKKTKGQRQQPVNKRRAKRR